MQRESDKEDKKSVCAHRCFSRRPGVLPPHNLAPCQFASNVLTLFQVEELKAALGELRSLRDGRVWSHLWALSRVCIEYHWYYQLQSVEFFYDLYTQLYPTTALCHRRGSCACKLEYCRLELKCRLPRCTCGPGCGWLPAEAQIHACEIS